MICTKIHSSSNQSCDLTTNIRIPISIIIRHKPCSTSPPSLSCASCCDLYGLSSCLSFSSPPTPPSCASLSSSSVCASIKTTTTKWQMYEAFPQLDNLSPETVIITTRARIIPSQTYHPNNKTTRHYKFKLHYHMFLLFVLLLFLFRCFSFLVFFILSFCSFFFLFFSI